MLCYDWPCLITVAVVQLVNETIPALQKLKEEGLVKYIGITGYPLDIYTYVLDRSATPFSLQSYLLHIHNTALPVRFASKPLPQLMHKYCALTKARRRNRASMAAVCSLL